MKTTRKNIIFSRLLLILLILPSLWQLEHVFDNDHGVVYYQNQINFSKEYNASCFALHKQLIFQSTFNLFVYAPFTPNIFQDVNIELPTRIYLRTVKLFSLRAPPVPA